jgi:flagellar biosynthesis protein FlhG
MARSGLRVLLVDLDLGLANLNLILGVHVTRGLEKALAGELSTEALRPCLVPCTPGLDLLPAGQGEEGLGRLRPAERACFARALSTLSADYDLVIGDSAAGIGPDVLAFASIADRVMVVTTPEVAALADAYGLIKALDQYGIRSGADVPTPEILVNHARDVEEGRSVARTITAASRGRVCNTPSPSVPANFL